MNYPIGLLLLLQLAATANAFAPSRKTPQLLQQQQQQQQQQKQQRSSPLFSSSSSSSSSSGSSGGKGDSTTVESLKTELLQKIVALKDLQEQDGKINVDFGVKGGEIDQKSRAPRKLDFYTVSERVGTAADSIFETVTALSMVNPTPKATEGFGDKAYRGSPPLEGAWNLLFSTAADASFSRDSKRGDAKAGNIVDARNGRMTNVVTFAPNVDEDGKTTPKAVDQLRVKLSCTAEGPNRVNLVFKYVAVKFTRFFFLPLRWTLYVPVPGPAIGRLVVGVSNLKRKIGFLFRTKKNNNNNNNNKPPKRELPKAFFDVLFLDGDLRVHKTGEDNLFIQARPEWKAAWETTIV